MKADTRTLINDHLIPGLRARGFSGSFPHFRRITESGVRLLTFQLDKWGSGDFVAELAKAPPGHVATGRAGPVPSSKLTAHHFIVRLRLGAKNVDSDHWFRYRELARDPDGAAAKFLDLLDSQGARWWDGA